MGNGTLIYRSLYKVSLLSLPGTALSTFEAKL